MSHMQLSRPANIACLALLTVFCWHPTTASAATPNKSAESRLESYDSRFQDFSARFYEKFVRQMNSPKADSMAALSRQIGEHQQQKQQILAVADAMANLALVEKNADTAAVIPILDMLLDANEWKTASTLHQKILKQGDKSLVSGVSFSMAKHYFSRGRWQDTIALVEKLRSDLPPEDYYHSQLLHGIALQNLQKHRPSLVHYSRIPPTSRHYVAARLNMAIANIRQDWWTDAHQLINELLDNKNIQGDTEITDRLYSVLGYSLLKQQYYRNARDTFRKVGLEGSYSNRALLGIALTAAYQEDYLGALNATEILMKRKQHDLPVDEAHLLAPHFQEKLRELDAATAGYAKAVAYFEERIQNIKAAAAEPNNLLNQIATGNSSAVLLGQDRYALGEKLPRFFFQNARLLAQFRLLLPQLNDAALTRQLDALESDYGSLLQKTVTKLAEERIDHLTHYMNQSRYGAARMQDRDAIEKK